MMKIVIIISFLIVLGFFFFATLPVSLTGDEVSEAVSNVVSKSEVAVDEDLAEQLALQLVDELENEQSKRLKYLASAYLVIWLVFMLYLLRLGKQHQTLAQRLSQLE